MDYSSHRGLEETSQLGLRIDIPNKSRLTFAAAFCASKGVNSRVTKVK